MDRTLKRATRRNKRRSNRNHGAWRRFSPDGRTCRYCKHNGAAHLCSSRQPHFYPPATEAERLNPYEQLYRRRTTEGDVLVKRIIVAKHAELITAFCTTCAGEIGTAQVLCYQRTLANGEVVGVETRNQIAA